MITGFEYVYNELNLITLEIDLAKNTEMWYTYDELGRVTKRVTTNTETGESSTENYAYDAAGNLIQAKSNVSFVYDTNNRLVSYNGNEICYDADGNMVCTYDPLEKDIIAQPAYIYDSSNRLICTGDNEYTYNVENTRIRNLCEGVETKYVYDVNSRLNKLLVKTTDGVTTKYVYGRGLIGEEDTNGFKTYHFDYRGSTVALTNIAGKITDTFSYDTYGKLISRTGTSEIIFGYNGRDGVVTDDNGLIYMRARYYSPAMKRFINTDIVAGKLSNAITLNRFAYANGNPVSFVDPFGLSAERGGTSHQTSVYGPTLPYTSPVINKTWQELGFKYDGSMRDFRRLEQGLPPYAYEVWLKQKQEKQTYYSVSWKSISGSVGNDTASASGGLYAGTAYAGLMDKGLGAEAGISGATAEGNLTLGNLSLDGEANVLAAEASAEFLYEDGFKLGAEAKASVATAEASFTIDLWLFEIEIGANADFLSAGAEANVTAGKNDEGQFEIGAEAGIGALLFGFGLDISLIFG